MFKVAQLIVLQVWDLKGHVTMFPQTYRVCKFGRRGQMYMFKLAGR